MLPMRVVSHPGQLDAAWRQVRGELVAWLAPFLPTAPESILEVGCGRGEITAPLAELFPGARLTAVDRFQGPYARGRPALSAALRGVHAEARATIVRADVLQWLTRRQPSCYDLVLSSEFLPELDGDELDCFVRRVRNVLSPGGTTAHLFLDPRPRNARQRIVVDADSSPRGGRNLPQNWFSPPPSLVRRGLVSAGFAGSRILRRTGGLRARDGAARQLLTRWGAPPAFLRRNAERLRKEGLELPDWIAVLGTRPRTPVRPGPGFAGGRGRLRARSRPVELASVQPTAAGPPSIEIRRDPPSPPRSPG